MAEPSYVPTPAERKKLSPIYEDIKKDQAEKKGAEDAAKGKTGSRGAMKESPFKKGGYVRSADGCVKRGKTKGRII